MLVLSRKTNERILIGDNIVLTVVDVHGRQVRLGIEAPASVSIQREELHSPKHADSMRFSGGGEGDWFACQWRSAGRLAEVG